MVRGLGRKRNKSARSARSIANYYRGQPQSASPFEKKAVPKSYGALASKIIDTLLILILLFCVLYSLIIKPDPKIIASSTIYRPASDYQVAATKDLKSFKDHNKLTFDESALIKSLQTEFPEIENANVELPLFGQKPIIRLSVATPKFIFDSQGREYLIASDGVIVSDNSNLPAARNLPVVTDKSGFSAALGKRVLSSAEVDFINQVVLQCTHANVPIKALTLPTEPQELYLTTKDEKYYVKFYLGGDSLMEVGQFLASRQQFAHQHVTPTQYLDVRVAGKIFYK